MRSRDVVFIEDKKIQDIGKPEKPNCHRTPHLRLSLKEICPRDK
jgi:hypothetical protein